MVQNNPSNAGVILGLLDTNISKMLIIKFY